MTEPRNHWLIDGLSHAEQAELGDLSRLEARLRTLDAPLPTAEEQTALVSRLAILQRAASPLPVEPLPSLARQPGTWLQLARYQVRWLGTPFWVASLLIFGLGMVLGQIGDGSQLAIAFVLCAPILAAVGVAYVFRPKTRSLRELEDISPVGTLELLYVRLGVVLAVNAVLCVTLLAMLVLHGPSQVVLGRLLLAWLGPMLALTGAALYASLRFGSPAGIAVPVGLWGLLIVLGWWQAALQDAWLLGEWLLVQINQSDLILVGSLASVLIGLAFVQQASRYLRQEIAVWR